MDIQVKQSNGLPEYPNNRQLQSECANKVWSVSEVKLITKVLGHHTGKLYAK